MLLVDVFATVVGTCCCCCFGGAPKGKDDVGSGAESLSGSVAAAGCMRALFTGVAAVCGLLDCAG